MPNHVHGIIVIDNDTVSLVNASNNERRGRFPFDPSFQKTFDPKITNPTVHDKTNPLFDPNHLKTKQIMERVKQGMYQSVFKQGTCRFVSKKGTNGNRPLQVTKRYRLGEMIRSFKANFTRQIKQLNPNTTFKWQRSFNDHIIRNEKELYAIRQYIRNNPKKW